MNNPADYILPELANPDANTPAAPDEAAPTGDPEALAEIARLNSELEKRYGKILSPAPALSRSLVSFQANKSRAVYRWFKYKEAFSAGLVDHLLRHCRVTRGILLDPFAGIGTALFAAGALGLQSEGIELLPIGQRVIATKQIIDGELQPGDTAALARWARERVWEQSPTALPIPELRITRGAYPPETQAAIGRFLAATDTENERVRAILLFALLSILENVSFTRKDGQYLRWDHRSGRKQGKKVFDKGVILGFSAAIVGKLDQILGDLQTGDAPPSDLFAAAPASAARAQIRLHPGSCLTILPQLAAGSYDAILTSPPYCNRYDYTRTYALELALLGVDEARLGELRQAMLSCTVENRAKDLLSLQPSWAAAIAAADAQPLLQSILAYLDEQRRLDQLNNPGIARMVRGYFYEMACVVAECARVLRPGAPLIMVNDNVRYAGASVSVDLILSELARAVGFEVESVLVLPNGKGNSSQQMGAHGRDPLRKCVYVWRREPTNTGKRLVPPSIASTLDLRRPVSRWKPFSSAARLRPTWQTKSGRCSSTARCTTPPI